MEEEKVPYQSDEEESKDDQMYGRVNPILFTDIDIGEVKSRSASPDDYSNSSGSSMRSHYSRASNWTKGRSR